MARRRTRIVVSLLAIAGWAIAAAPSASATTISGTPFSGWQTNGRVNAIVVGSNGWVYLAGTFTQVTDHSGHTFSRTRMAAIDKAGSLTAFNPKPNAAVRALAVAANGTVYFGGDFTDVGTTGRNRLAAVSSRGALQTGFAAGANSSVYALAVSAGEVYVGGNFTTIRGFTRTRLARVSAATGALDSTWKPTANALVRALAVPAGARTVFVGGTFTRVDATTQDHLASLAVGAGAVRPWKTHTDYAVWGLAASATSVYIAGAGNGGHMTAFAYPSGTRRWTVQTDGNFQTVAVVGQDVVGGGHFTRTCKLNTNCTNPVSHPRLLAANAATGVVDAGWVPQPNSLHGVYALAANATDLYAGGDFTVVGATAQAHLAEFAVTP
ncbi:MAG TPA: hypothetical protein VGL44_08085 [Gaiellales bacterium]